MSRHKKPNVLLICVDHWPGQLLGSSGHKEIYTPTIDQICENGIHFTQAYTSCPTCIPARRAIMTGTTSKTHGDRIFNETLEMKKELVTLPEAFSNAGYQTYAVGKLHVYPQRNRIGFHEVILNEEGRHHLGLNADDYELFLRDHGYAGQEQTHGMGVNQYEVRPWHLPESYHQTYWTTKEMCRTIQRRDPTRPAFWYCSYTAPHPPLTPIKDYLDMYADVDLEEPFIGEWAKEYDKLPYALKDHIYRKPKPTGPKAIKMARKAFYAQCTYIDHQIRLLIGTLREEGLLDNTILMLIGDHGDMLGNHNLWGKPPLFEYSVKVPMILSPVDNEKYGVVDERLVELRDVMPTLLDLCGIPIPETVEGHSIVGDSNRDYIYFEHYEDENAMRAIRWKDYKLIYYPTGNRFQLFDIKKDPNELYDKFNHPEYHNAQTVMTDLLIKNLYGSDLDWIKDNQLVGLPDKEYVPKPNRGLTAQRGWR